MSEHQAPPYPDEPCPLYHLDEQGRWGWGATCDGCAPPHFAGSKRYAGVRFSVRHLRAQNQRHYTVREEVAEIYEGARERGADITKA